MIGLVREEEAGRPTESSQLGYRDALRLTNGWLRGSGGRNARGMIWSRPGLFKQQCPIGHHCSATLS